MQKTDTAPQVRAQDFTAKPIGELVRAIMQRAAAGNADWQAILKREGLA